jgi:hypothetical protein
MNDERRDDLIEERMDDDSSGITKDAKTGAGLGAAGGAITGAAAGAAAGPAGAIAGAVIGGVVGGLASGAAVQAVDAIDGDGSKNETVDGVAAHAVGTGGTTVPMSEATSRDAVYGSDVADPVTAPDPRYDGDGIGIKHGARPGLPSDYDDHTNIGTRVVDPARYVDGQNDLDLPGDGIQTGGQNVDGSPDTRGMMEKAADAVTGDPYDDKTGKVVEGHMDRGIQTGGHNADGSPDTRGIMEKAADAITGDPYDDKTGKRHDTD